MPWSGQGVFVELHSLSEFLERSPELKINMELLEPRLVESPP
jgi:hypothetical protein